MTLMARAARKIVPPSRCNLVRDARRGATQVEMTICTFLLVMLLIGVVDISRMVLVYTAMSNAARAGTRYAIVHGSDRSTGSGVDGVSGPSSYSQITTVVKNFAGTSPLDTSKVTVTVDYPDSSNTAGSHVTVTVGYPFTPLVSYFPLSVNLASVSQGVITF